MWAREEGRRGIFLVRCLMAFGDDAVQAAGFPDGWMGPNITRSLVTVDGMTEWLVDSAGKFLPGGVLASRMGRGVRWASTFARSAI